MRRFDRPSRRPRSVATSACSFVASFASSPSTLASSFARFRRWIYDSAVASRVNYGGPFVHHFTREATAIRANHTRWEAVRAATLHVLNRTTLPRPPDQRAKCYLSGVGAEDIRPQLFRALPCGDEDTIIEAIGYIQS